MGYFRLFCTSFHTSLRLFAVNFAVVCALDAVFSARQAPKNVCPDPLGSLSAPSDPLAAKNVERKGRGRKGKRRGRNRRGGKGIGEWQGREGEEREGRKREEKGRGEGKR